MFKLLITIIAIATMIEGIAIPLVNYPIYDPSTETDNIDEQQDFIGNEMFKIIDDVQFNSFDTSPFSNQMLEKREHRHSADPCGCPYKTKLESYGDNAYPRHYRSKVCDEDKINMKKYCYYGGKCKEFFYEVRFLVPKKSEKSFSAHHLPSEINQLYGWVSKNISIDCRCLH